MTNKHALIVFGVVLAAGAVVYLASKREVVATIIAGEPTITYRSREKPIGEEFSVE